MPMAAVVYPDNYVTACIGVNEGEPTGFESMPDITLIEITEATGPAHAGDRWDGTVFAPPSEVSPAP